jgi:hypothetical protein
VAWTAGFVSSTWLVVGNCDAGNDDLICKGEFVRDVSGSKNVSSVAMNNQRSRTPDAGLEFYGNWGEHTF